MTSRKVSSETNNIDKKTNKASGWRKVVTTVSITLAGFFTSCDKVPNDEIILDSDKQSVAVSFEYQFGNPDSGTLVDYNIFAQKQGEKYEGIIEKRSDGLFSDTIRIESNNIDGLFEEIANKSDSKYITENTRTKKNAKLAFAKQVYEDSILNNKNPSKGETRIKYKKK